MSIHLTSIYPDFIYCIEYYLMRVLTVHRFEVTSLFAQASFREISLRVQASVAGGRFELMFAEVRLQVELAA